MIFAVADLLVAPYRPFAGASAKNDAIFAACVAHPERFLVSPRSGDPSMLTGELLTAPTTRAWEVWQNDVCKGILLLDRIVPAVDARLQFVFFDDELASKTPLLLTFIERCFAEFGFARLSFEVPEHMNVLLGFARRKLGFRFEGEGSWEGAKVRLGSRRERAYWDGARWHDVMLLRRHAED